MMIQSLNKEDIAPLIGKRAYWNVVIARHQTGEIAMTKTESGIITDIVKKNIEFNNSGDYIYYKDLMSLRTEK